MSPSADEAPISSLDPVLEDLVAEITDRLQAGDPVDQAAYLARYPEYSGELRRLLPALEMMAELGSATGPVDVRPRPIAPGPLDELGLLGDFRLLREIGRGGMGIVYEAEQLSLRRRVALKVLPFASALDARQIQRFQVEAQAAACLHHPHIVPVHGVGCERGVHYYAMQLIEGQSLAAMIGELRRLDGLDPGDAPAADLAAIATSDLAARLLSGGAPGRPGAGGSDAPTAAFPVSASPPPAPTPAAPPAGRTASSGSSTRTRSYIRAAARLALEAAEALDHAHARGILHRDIKPGNLLLDAEGRLWVTDFGLAQVRGDDRLTLTGDLLGTLRYMSPEQALGRRVVIDGRTDVYSLGVTLYELLTLRPAVDGRDRAEILRRIADGEPPPLRKVNPAVPTDLETIVARAMDKEPGARYATARDLADDLRNYVEDRPIRARRPSLADRARRWGRRHRTLAWSATMTVLVAALMLAGSIGYVARDRAARLAQAGQRVAVALAGARTAIEAGNLTLAGQRVAEAQGHLGPDRERLPGVAADTDRIRHEIEARQADTARLDQFLKGASDALDKMSFGADLGGERIARETLGLYGVLTEKDWSSCLESSYLTAGQKQQVRETAYVLLVSLADFVVRWNWGPREDRKAFARSLDLLQRAQSFHQPTRAFYFVRRVCRQQQGDTAAAAEDEKQFKAAAARTAWDYYLPGHSAGWGGDLDEAIRSYQAALRLQPDHYNSLFFLALRLAANSKRYPEAIAYFTGCIALRPNDSHAYRLRGACYSDLGQLDDAVVDMRQALRLHPDWPVNHGALGHALRRKGRPDEALAANREWIRLQPHSAAAHNNLAWILANSLDPKFRDPARAVEVARKAIELAPQGSGFWNTLGVAHFRTGDWKASVAALEKSMELGNGGDAIDWFFLAMAHWRLGRRNEARDWYDKAAAWDAKNLGRPEKEELLGFRAEAAALLGVVDLPEDVFARP
jgi:serine/threonine protein kinase/tetratricopeptide (TPR) repeat protein